MTRTFFTLAILAALCLNIVSAQTVNCSCEWLQTVLNTVNLLGGGDSFQISSIDLNTYYIPSYINSACGNIGAFAQVEASSSSEVRKVNRKEQKFTLAADNEPSSFLELTQAVSATDVLNALVFDTLCINQFGVNSGFLGDDQAYCSNPLRAYFYGTNFPNTNGKDDSTQRSIYANAAFNWYTTDVYNYLQCTF